MGIKNSLELLTVHNTSRCLKNKAKQIETEILFFLRDLNKQNKKLGKESKTDKRKLKQNKTININQLK